MTAPADFDSSPARSRRPAFFAAVLRLVLAPSLCLFSGFFTANFVISGQYTWPRTSRAFALTLTVVILSYEFIYKEHLAIGATADRAKRVLIQSCLIPYIIGVLIMMLLWKV